MEDDLQALAYQQELEHQEWIEKRPVDDINLELIEIANKEREQTIVDLIIDSSDNGFVKGEDMNAFELAIVQVTGSEAERIESVAVVEKALQPFVTKVSSYQKGNLIAEFSPK